LATTASASYLQGLSQILDIYYVAHIDSDTVNGVPAPKIRLSSYEFFNGWTTAVVDQTSSSLLATVATRVYGGKLYIFYSSPQGGEDTLKVAVYDGTKFVTQVIDGLGGPNGQIAGNMYMPTAVEADGLRVYYHDNSHGTLREAHSPDGVTWTDFTVVDGPGVAGDRDLVGWWPAAIVFNGTVNIFYTDFTNQWLRIAQRAGGTWTYGWIEPVDVQTYKAPVVHGNEMQVYYESGGKLRVAYGTGPGQLSLAALDGGEGGIPTGIAVGAVSDPMGFYSTAVEVNGITPSVFYWDTQSGKLRNVYWK
jgi:hypothetical protein